MVCELVEYNIVFLRTILVCIAEAISPITVAVMYNGITSIIASNAFIHFSFFDGYFCALSSLFILMCYKYIIHALETEKTKQKENETPPPTQQ